MNADSPCRVRLPGFVVVSVPSGSPSRLKRYAAFFTLVLGLLVSPAAAQPAATGTVEGRVQNGPNGSYLNNARVTAVGLSKETFTNASGEFRFTDLPAGELTLEVFYTGWEKKQAKVTVPAGAAIRQDFQLMSQARQQEDDVLVLDDFVVAAQREYNATAVAINEQRFSANKREVVSIDAFGEINQGNIGEFVKHLPGVSFEIKDGNNPSGIMVRGFNSNYTNVTLDGGQLASAALANTQTHTRQFVLEQANINNLAYIEVVKLPTPDMSANLLGGAVNFVSKSAFSRAKPELRTTAYLSGNSKELHFNKTAGPIEDGYKVLPSLDISYVNPVSKTFGFVVNAAQSSQFYLQNKSVFGRRYSGSGASLTNPQTPNVGTSYAPNRVDRTSGSVKLDWKPWESLVIEFSAQANAFKQQQGSRTINFNVGSGTPVAWGETFTRGSEGTSGTGTSSLGNSFQVRHGLTRALSARATYTGRDWTAQLAGGFSHSNSNARDMDSGFWRGVSTTLRNVKTVRIEGIDNDSASYGSVTVLDGAGNAIDPTKLANYNLTTVQGEPQSAEDTLKEVRGYVTKAFSPFGAPLTVKVGGNINDLEREIDYAVFATTYMGPDGIANSGDEGMGNFIDDSQVGVSPGFGAPGAEWPSPWKIWEAYVAHPTWFARTSNQQGDTIRNNAVRSPRLHETITSLYAMGDLKLFHNRLRLVGGVRYELTDDEGWGVKQDSSAVFQRDASGNLIKVNNAFVRKPEAGAAGSAQDAALIYQYRGNYNARDYDGFYPSLHTTFNITDNLLFRAAFAKTIGRPRLVDIVPNLNVSDNVNFPSTSSSPGTITSANTTLKPWTGKNYDFSLEYYLPKNGVLSLNVFRKDIRDFFSTISRIADEALLEELGLPATYVGYNYNTRINVSDARIDGWEANAVLPLGNFFKWGEHFVLRGNITRLKLSGSRTSASDFGNYIPNLRNVGVGFSFGRLTGNMLLNYKGKMLRDTSSAFTGANEYIRARYQLDGSVEFRLTDRFSLFAAGRNLMNDTTQWEVSGPDAPSWAALTNYEEYGVQYSLGIKGVF